MATPANLIKSSPECPLGGIEGYDCMFLLITVSILLLTAMILLVLNFATPNFRYNWLIATGGALLGWISVFVWQAQMPMSIKFPAWQPALLFTQSPTFVG